MVSRLGSWYGRWAEKAHELVASPRSLPMLGTSLAVLGLVEVFTRAAISQLDVESALALALLALGSTLPLTVFGARRPQHSSSARQASCRLQISTS